MKSITLTIAAVGVAALPQTLQVPGTYTGCAPLINNCCKTAPGLNTPKFTDCSVLTGPLPNYVYFIQSCTPSLKVPSCCTEKKSNLIEGFFNQVLGTSLGESQCVLPPQP
ncbi:Beta-ketoacyl synthase [Metarhizium brunneum]